MLRRETNGTVHRLVFLSILSLFFFGCMSFGGNKMPVTDWPPDARLGTSQTVFLDISYNNMNLQDDLAGIDTFRMPIEEFIELSSLIAGESKLFGGYAVPPANPEGTAFTIRMNMDVQSHDSFDLSIIKLCLSSLTLFVFPYWDTYAYGLNAALIDNSTGIEAKTFRYVESRSDWMSVLLLPFSFFGKDSEELDYRIKSKMLMTLYEDVSAVLSAR